MLYLDGRASKALLVARIVPGALIDEAADQLAQRYADSLGGA